MGVISEIVETTNIHEAELGLRRFFADVQLREPDGGFFLRQAVRGDECVTVSRFEIQAPLTARVEIDGVAQIGHTLGGEYRAWSNGEEIDPLRPFVLRPGAARSRSENLDLLMVTIHLRALRPWIEAASVQRDGRIGFPGTAPVSPAATQHWARTVQYVSSVVSASELLHNDLVRA